MNNPEFGIIVVRLNFQHHLMILFVSLLFVGPKSRQKKATKWIEDEV